MSAVMQEETTKIGQVSKRTKEEIFNDELLGLEVLCYLDDLGFSTKHPGTYIYKDLILKMIYIISDDGVSNEDVLATVQNPYSVIYEDVAKYIYGIEILDLHKYVYQSCPDDDFKRCYVRKALEIANNIVSREKTMMVLRKKKSEEI